jgi:demethoxyubiquinone hydroxylase (CLK1/Coq7/Cat5 family)
MSDAYEKEKQLASNLAVTTSYETAMRLKAIANEHGNKMADIVALSVAGELISVVFAGQPQSFRDDTLKALLEHVEQRSKDVEGLLIKDAS